MAEQEKGRGLKVARLFIFDLAVLFVLTAGQPHYFFLVDIVMSVDGHG
jgi:hypothetical protein